MKKLEVLSMYLPFQVWVENLNYKVDYVGVQYSELTTIYQPFGKGFESWHYKTSVWNNAPVDKCKPILYPLDLTQPIWCEGKEIVPIMELYNKIHINQSCRLRDYELKKTALGSSLTGWSIDDRRVYFDLIIGGTLHGLHNASWYQFECRIGDVKHQRLNQLELFQQLLKWRINLWLKDDEFINVNDLDTNPYK